VARARRYHWPDGLFFHIQQREAAVLAAAQLDHIEKSAGGPGRTGGAKVDAEGSTSTAEADKSSASEASADGGNDDASAEAVLTRESSSAEAGASGTDAADASKALTEQLRTEMREARMLRKFQVRVCEVARPAQHQRKAKLGSSAQIDSLAATYKPLCQTLQSEVV
jgi:hypothetical protein